MRTFLFVLDTKEKAVEFTVLWLPERFPKLYAYLLITLVVVTLSTLTYICNCCISAHVAYNQLPIV